MVEGTISFEGTEHFEKVIKQANKGFKDFTPMWPVVRDTLNYIMLSRFRSRNFGNWKKHSPASALLSGPSGTGKVLVRSGRLMRSLTRPGGADSIFRTSKNKMLFGTSVPYASVHNEGKDISVTPNMRRWFAGRGVYLSSGKSKITIPKRRFMFITRRNAKRLEKVLKDYAKTQIGGGKK